MYVWRAIGCLTLSVCLSLSLSFASCVCLIATFAFICLMATFAFIRNICIHSLAPASPPARFMARFAFISYSYTIYILSLLLYLPSPPHLHPIPPLSQTLSILRLFSLSPFLSHTLFLCLSLSLTHTHTHTCIPPPYPHPPTHTDIDTSLHVGSRALTRSLTRTHNL